MVGGGEAALAVAPGRVVGAVLDTDVLEPARRDVVALLIDVVVAARVFVRPPKLPVVAFRNAFVVTAVANSAPKAKDASAAAARTRFSVLGLGPSSGAGVGIVS